MNVDPQSPLPSLSATRRLLHRWLVQYNPLYLISAALVLVGVITSSTSLAGGGTLAQLGVTVVAELYAWALIGSAALLVRMGLRRPALMLILLTAVYQCDLTLHTETCVYLGLPGVIGSALWWVSFVAKLRAMVAVMRVRLSYSALFVISGGAAMIAVVPWALRMLEPATSATVVAAGLYALAAGALWTERRVHSRLVDGPWAATVAHRSLRAIWLGWGTMTLLHVGFWFSQNPSLPFVVLVPVAALVSTRLFARESATWAIVIATLVVMGFVAPALFALTAAMGAVTLVLRALRKPTYVAPPAPVDRENSDDVYREDPETETPAVVAPPPRLIFCREEPAACARLLTGAAGCIYLAAWTAQWSGGAWPAHPWWLLVALAATTVLVLKRHHYTFAALPTLVSGHLVASSEWIASPRSALQWGVTCITLGFALLALGLALTVWWRHRLVTVPSPEH